MKQTIDMILNQNSSAEFDGIRRICQNLRREYENKTSLKDFYKKAKLAKESISWHCEKMKAISFLMSQNDIRSIHTDFIVKLYSPLIDCIHSLSVIQIIRFEDPTFGHQKHIKDQMNRAQKEQFDEIIKMLNEE